MARDESEVVLIGKAKPKEKLGPQLASINELFKAKRIFIFCEGEIEYNYFVGFNQAHNNSRVRVIPRFPSGSLNEGTDIRELVEQIIISKQDKKVIVRLNNKLIALNIKPNDEFNIIFDVDANFTINKYGQSKYDEAIKLFKKDEIKLYSSNYSFEIWILCHFEKPPTGLMKNRHLKIKDILPHRIRKKHLSEYRNDYKLIYQKLESELNKALENSDSLLADKKRAGIVIHSIDSEPVTEVGLFIKNIKKELI